jgi:hypothetical protein
MKYYGFTTDFLKSHGPLSWRHMSWALDQGLVGWKDLVEFAKEGTPVTESFPEATESLRTLDKSSAHRTRELVEFLSGAEPQIAQEEIKRKWWALILDWILTNRGSFDDPLAEVEEIYADFDYPEELAPLVRYMPPTDGWRPDEHSSEANIDRLYRHWRDLVARKRKEYGWIS